MAMKLTMAMTIVLVLVAALSCERVSATLTNCEIQGGKCISPKLCPAQHGDSSESGLCPGADKCCLPAPCTRQNGKCGEKADCVKAKGTPKAGLCPFDSSSTVQCCFNPANSRVTRTPSYVTLTKSGINEIAMFEVSSEAYYVKKLQSPTWPGGASGVTIGIGYDIGYVSETVLRADWKDLKKEDLDLLAKVVGKTGTKARDSLDLVSSVVVPLDIAKKVFLASSVPSYSTVMMEAFPGVETLPADAQTMMLSLVYNRGTSFDGDSRKEMRYIRNALATTTTDVKTKITYIAAEFVAMKRLWVGKGLDGLLARRDREAALITASQKTYPASDLHYVSADGSASDTKPSGDATIVTGPATTTATTPAASSTSEKPTGTSPGLPSSTDTVQPSSSTPTPSSSTPTETASVQPTPPSEGPVWGPKTSIAVQKQECKARCSTAKSNKRIAASNVAEKGSASFFICDCAGETPFDLAPPSETYLAERVTGVQVAEAKKAGPSSLAGLGGDKGKPASDALIKTAEKQNSQNPKPGVIKPT